MHKTLASVFLLFSLSFCQTESFLSSPDCLIKITGFGQVATQADMAIVQISLSHYDSSLIKSRLEVGKAVIRLLDTLGKYNKSVLKIGLGQLKEYPHSECNNSALKNTFDVSKEITLTIKDVTKIDTILYKAEQCGANISRDISWKHSREDSLMAIAVDKACVSAKERAELYAKRFGVKIIKITKILPDYYETAGENFGANYDASKVIYQGTSITIQNVVINSRVTIIYKFK